jgi:hypothetical protein
MHASGGAQSLRGHARWEVDGWGRGRYKCDWVGIVASGRVLFNRANLGKMGFPIFKLFQTCKM